MTRGSRQSLHFTTHVRRHSEDAELHIPGKYVRRCYPLPISQPWYPHPMNLRSSCLSPTSRNPCCGGPTSAVPTKPCRRCICILVCRRQGTTSLCSVTATTPGSRTLCFLALVRCCNRTWVFTESATMCLTRAALMSPTDLIGRAAWGPNVDA